MFMRPLLKRGLGGRELGIMAPVIRKPKIGRQWSVLTWAKNKTLSPK
jgi:hypothetical protein